MSANPLFIDPPVIDPAEFFPTEEARKCADMRLQSPPGMWQDEILDSVMRDHPFLPLDRLVLTFREKDDARGAALGYISVSGAPRVTIPVIVAGRRLKPMDVMIIRGGDTELQQGTGDMTDDKVQPLTRTNFSKALDQGSPGTLVQDHELAGSQIANDGSGLRLPFRGRTVLAHVLGATETQKTALATAIALDPRTAAGLALTSQDITDAWLAAPDPTGRFAAKLAGVTHVPLAQAQVIQDLPKVAAADFLACPVYRADGTLVDALAFDAFDLIQPTQKLAKYLVYADGSYAPVNGSVVLGELPEPEQQAQKAATIVQTLGCRALSRGDTIVLGLGEACTAPAKLAAMHLEGDTDTIILTLTDGLRSAEVTVSPAVKTAILGPDGWVIPRSSTILKLADYATDSGRPMEPQKVGSLVRALAPHRILCKDGQFSAELADDVKLAMVDRAACEAAMGAWLVGADELLDLAQQQGEVRFAANLQATKSALLGAHNWVLQAPKKVAEFLESCRLPLDKAVKLAAALPTSESADAVLGTSFVNEDNMTEFAGLGDEFEDIVGKLARLLLFIRMGEPAGDEAAVMVAMKSLQRVIDSLQSITADTAGV
jgi:hypothetical protein